MSVHRYQQPDPATRMHHARGRSAHMPGGASRRPPSLRALATHASRPPAFADIFLYHRDSSFRTWALLQLLHAADEPYRACRSTEDLFSQSSKVLLDPTSTEVVDPSRKFMMNAVSAIAGIVSAGGQHAQLHTQHVSMRTCSLWNKQPSFMLAMCSEIMYIHCAR